MTKANCHCCSPAREEPGGSSPRQGAHRHPPRQRDGRLAATACRHPPQRRTATRRTAAPSLAAAARSNNKEAHAHLRSKADIEQAYEAHAKTVYRVCYAFLGRAQDAEDATQETFVRLMRHDAAFTSDEHLKAWLIRAASNVCRDTRKRAEARRRADIVPQDVRGLAAPPEEFDATLEVVLALPERYKDVVYLYYYEGYTSAQMARILDRPASTVRSLLSEARAILRDQLGGEMR